MCSQVGSFQIIRDPEHSVAHPENDMGLIQSLNGLGYPFTADPVLFDSLISDSVYSDPAASDLVISDPNASDGGASEFAVSDSSFSDSDDTRCMIVVIIIFPVRVFTAFAQDFLISFAFAVYPDGFENVAKNGDAIHSCKGKNMRCFCCTGVAGAGWLRAAGGTDDGCRCSAGAAVRSVSSD